MLWKKIKTYLSRKGELVRNIPSLRALSTKGNTPNFIQIEATECGATALGMIMGYYKKFVSAEILRVDCGVSRNGSKANNILKAARAYGMIAHGSQIADVADIAKKDFPVIAFWEFNHFLVIEGYDKYNVHLNDPAKGYVSLPHDIFNKSFTGVVLTLKPGPNFVADGENPSALPPIKPLIKEHFVLFVFMCIAATAALIPAIIIPGSSKIFVDDILTKQYIDWFRPLCLIVGFVGGIGAALMWLEQSFLLTLNVRITSWLATRFVWHTMNLPFPFFASRYTADILSRISSIFSFSQFLSGGFSSAITSLITVAFYLIIMLVISLKLTLILLALTLLGAAVTWYHKHYLSIQNHLILGSYSTLMGIEMGGLQTIETLKASGSEFEFLNKRSGAFNFNLQDRQGLASYEISLDISTQFISTLSTIILIGFGSLMIMDGQLSIGTFIAFQLLAAGFTAPLTILSNLSAGFQAAKMSLIRLKDTLNYPVAIETTIPRIVLDSPLMGSIRMENINFSYSPLDAPNLININLDIPAGSTCALVGKSGNGKSTIALLLAGLNRPNSGKILIDNIPIEQLDQDTRKEMIGMIDADLGIFEGTLQDNITLFQKDVSPILLENAIRISCLEDVVDRIGGLQGYLTEGGSNLSGGQRQRIEIARLLFQSPKILILDEATSNIDHHREAQIQDTLTKLGHTLIVISHRLTTIQHSDQILIIDKGEIVDRGKHEELLIRNPLYNQLTGSEE